MYPSYRLTHAKAVALLDPGNVFGSFEDFDEGLAMSPCRSIPVTAQMRRADAALVGGAGAAERLPGDGVASQGAAGRRQPAHREVRGGGSGPGCGDSQDCCGEGWTARTD